MATSKTARAKVNLALHVTGQRPDGYHLLDSLVCFADIGDVLTASAGDELRLDVRGPMAAGVPRDQDNLVLRAARSFANAKGAHLSLLKNLPVASGLGGGSADAAACLRLLADLWQVDLPDPETILALGADVPVCLFGGAARIGGIGERIDKVPEMPGFEALLVNPGGAVSTPEIFGALAQKTNPKLAAPPTGANWRDWISYLKSQRNDLQQTAISKLPVIAQVIDMLETLSGCQLARMSGSGATCFGLFETPDQVLAAADTVRRWFPAWWVSPARLNQATRETT